MSAHGSIRFRTEATGCTDALPTHTGLAGIWCYQCKDEHHSASVLSLFRRSRLAAIHDPIVSKQSDTWFWSASDSEGQLIPRIWVSSAYAWSISPWPFTTCSTSATYKDQPKDHPFVNELPRKLHINVCRLQQTEWDTGDTIVTICLASECDLHPWTEKFLPLQQCFQSELVGVGPDKPQTNIRSLREVRLNTTLALLVLSAVEYM